MTVTEVRSPERPQKETPKQELAGTAGGQD